MASVPKSQKFSIDDAFDDEEDDIIRSYGATTESTPLKPKPKTLALPNHVDEGLVVRVEPTKDRLRLANQKVPDDSLSKDSDSLIQSDIFNSEKYDSQKGWWNHPRVKENWRVMLAAFGLLIIGLGLLVTGIVVQIMPKAGIQSFVFFIAGSICLIPGAYHVVYVYCAVKGRQGYEFHNLPLFN